MAKAKQTTIATPVKVAPLQPKKKTAAQPVELPPTKPVSKQHTLISLMKRPTGASIEELMKATGWQRHSVHGTLSGALKKRLGLPIITEFGESGRMYRIVDARS